MQVGLPVKPVCTYKHLGAQVWFQPDVDDQHYIVITYQCNLNSSWVYMMETDDNVSVHWWAEGKPQGKALKAAHGDKSI